MSGRLSPERVREIQHKITSVLPEEIEFCKFSRCSYKPCSHSHGVTCLQIHLRQVDK